MSSSRFWVVLGPASVIAGVLYYVAGEADLPGGTVTEVAARLLISLGLILAGFAAFGREDEGRETE